LTVRETRERIIEAVGEIDREVDDFYIPRIAIQELLDGFADLGEERESFWTKLVKIFVRLMKFLIGIIIVLVLPFMLPAYENIVH
jgi:hypothetical protein